MGALMHLAWAILMMRVRYYENRLGFAHREIFHDALRHRFKDEAGAWCGTVDWPDSFFYTTRADFRRAKDAVEADKALSPAQRSSIPNHPKGGK